MGADKPLIAILMAVYEPRMDWLVQQLDSLEEQDYPNLRLYVRDDCSPTVRIEQIERCVREHIRSFPYEVRRNETNLGSNGTFELMTRTAEGEYFAYCDQDDIWLPEKLTVLQREMERQQAQLVCSDMYIIDGNGAQTADSITKIRRHHVFRSGEGLTDTLWYSNFASGCALLVRAQTAKASLPLDPYMYYDHYITLYCANAGRVVSLPERLIRHREHGDNQSSTMQGVVDRASYLAIRVDRPANAVQWLAEHFVCGEPLKTTLTQGLAWLQARQRHIRGERGQWRTIWKYRRFSPNVSLFEIALPYLPECLLRVVIWAGRKNYI